MGLFERSRERDQDTLDRLRRAATPAAPQGADGAEDTGDWRAPMRAQLGSAPPIAPLASALDAALDELLMVPPTDSLPQAAAPAPAATPPAPTSPAANAAGMVAAEPSGPPTGRVFFPLRPTSVEATGLSRTFLVEHVLRTIYFGGEMTGAAVADIIGLPFPNVVDKIIEQLRRESALDVRGQRGVGEAGYVFTLSDKGTVRAQEALQKTMYRGAAPVPLDDYCQSVAAQSHRPVVTQDNIRAAFRDLIIADSVLDEVGPAVNAGQSIFLFGYPGNGKTSIAERITRLMGDSLFIPHAVEVDGQVIKLFDAVLHQPVEVADGAPRLQHDRRWVEVPRPTVIAGGELTMASLDLLYNAVGRFYEAPLQMKANGGMFLIDDFGRQLVRPDELLNRWIVPLEKRADFLTLVTGKKLTIPFEQLIVFSTNLDPNDLVDDAFLRRIKFKINIADPDVDQFRAIFRLVAQARGIAFDEAAFAHLLQTTYTASGRPMRMCHPRDLLDQLIAIARYKMLEPAMTPALLNLAASTYFVNTGGAS